MTKLKRRELPDPRFINVDGSPRLDLRFNQVEFNGKDHGLIIKRQKQKQML